MTGLNIKRESCPTPHGDMEVLILEGYLDGHTAPKLMRQIDELLGQQRFRLVLDLAGLTYMSSAGFGILAATQKRTQQRGGDVKAVHLSEKIQRAFVTLGLEELIEIHPTRESAFEAFAKPPGAGAS